MALVRLYLVAGADATSVGEIAGLSEDLAVVVAQRAEVCHVVVAMDLGEAAVLVPEVASLAVEAELFTVERSAILALVLVVLILLPLTLVHNLLTISINGELLDPVGVLALDTVAAEAGLGPVLAHLALVH